MLAATDVHFTQKLISQREQILRMSEAQLPFGQLPLLQIDGLELVQSQAIVRYLARRSGLQGLTSDEVVKCDMIAEAVRDLLSLATSAPFKRKYYEPVQQLENGLLVVTAAGAGNTVANSGTVPPSKSTSVTPPSAPQSAESVPTPVPAPYDNTLQHDPSDPAWQEHLQAMKTKWAFIGQRFEAILRSNRMQLAQQQKRQLSIDAKANASASSTVSGSNNTASSSALVKKTATASVNYMVGSALTYADILVAHITTWYVEECGPEIVADMPMVVGLQNAVISLPGVTKFIKSIHYFPLGDRAYLEQVNTYKENIFCYGLLLIMPCLFDVLIINRSVEC